MYRSQFITFAAGVGMTIAVALIPAPNSLAQSAAPSAQTNSAAADALIEWHNHVADYVSDHPEDYAAISTTADGSLLITPSISAGVNAETQLKESLQSETKSLASLLAGSDTAVPQLKFQPAQTLSQANLLAAQSRLLAALKAKPSWGAGITDYGPTLNGNFTVGTTGDTSEALAQKIGSLIGIPVTLVKSLPSYQDAGRLDDRAPWSGGSRIVGPKYCTGGFGVTRGAPKYIITAGHCGTGTWRNGNGSFSIGGTPVRSYHDGAFDVQLIGPVTSLTGRLWWQPLDSGTAVSNLYTIVVERAPFA